MGLSRELIEKREYGVRIWVCSHCRWAHAYRRPAEMSDDSRESAAQKLFALHVCADHPPMNKTLRNVD